MCGKRLLSQKELSAQLTEDFPFQRAQGSGGKPPSPAGPPFCERGKSPGPAGPPPFAKGGRGLLLCGKRCLSQKELSAKLTEDFSFRRTQGSGENPPALRATPFCERG